MGLGGPVGLDLPAAAAAAVAHGVPRRVALILLPYLEQGFFDAHPAEPGQKG